MDNLPPMSQTEMEDDIVLSVAVWSRRKRLTTLKYLYLICQVRIADLNHEIAEEQRREVREKAPSIP